MAADVAPAGRQRRSQFQVDPGLRPVIGLTGAALQSGDDVVNKGIVRSQGPQQFAAPANGQDRAAEDLARLDRIHFGLLDDPALANRRRDVDLPLPQRHPVRQLAQWRLQFANLPRGHFLHGRVGADGLENNLRQPRGIGLVEFQGAGVVE